MTTLVKGPGPQTFDLSCCNCRSFCRFTRSDIQKGTKREYDPDPRYDRTFTIHFVVCPECKNQIRVTNNRYISCAEAVFLGNDYKLP